MENENVWNLLEKGAGELGIHLLPAQLEQFRIFFRLLTEKNKVMNLTAITEPEDVIVKHFIDSLSVVKATDMQKIRTIMDMGTGAGFPGIPLKIVFPDISFVLADSLNKRIQFLSEVIEECMLENIEVVHARAEDLARNGDYRERFDLCLSRAVANLSSLSEYCLPFVKVNGAFISYKAGNVSEEISQAENAIRLLGGKKENVVSFQLPCSPVPVDRTLIVIRKTKQTPPRYPRKAGIPGKEPLH